MKEKKIHLELLRIFAIFFVLYSHTGMAAKFHYQIAGGIVSEMLSFTLLSLSKTCNTLFFMVTGAVLLQKEERFADIFHRRILKMAVILIIFSFFQYVCCYHTNPEIGFSIPVFFKIVYSAEIITQYWFLYAYLTLLIMLPFLRILAQGLTREHFIYLVLLYVLINGILPLVEYYWENQAINLSVPLLENMVLFPLAGYYIEHNKEDLFSKKQIIIMLNAVFVAALLIDLFYARSRYYKDDMPEATLDGMMLLMALAVFVDFRFLCKQVRLPNWLQKIILFLSGGAFTVYLLNPQLTELCHFFFEMLEPRIKWLPATVVWLSAAMIIGGMLAFLWHMLLKTVKWIFIPLSDNGTGAHYKIIS